MKQSRCSHCFIRVEEFDAVSFDRNFDYHTHRARSLCYVSSSFISIYMYTVVTLIRLFFTGDTNKIIRNRVRLVYIVLAKRESMLVSFKILTAEVLAQESTSFKPLPTDSDSESVRVVVVERYV